MDRHGCEVAIIKRPKSCSFKTRKKCTECWIVQNYTYLGTLIFSTETSLAVDRFKKKVLHALFSPLKQTHVSRLSPRLANNLFDSPISPILTCHSEIWGVYTKLDFKSWDSSQIEKAHLQYYKRYLEVSNKASNNVACRTELGRFPLIKAINQKIINYTLYLHNKENDSIVKKIFFMSSDLHHTDKSSFYRLMLWGCWMLVHGSKNQRVKNKRITNYSGIIGTIIRRSSMYCIQLYWC